MSLLVIALVAVSVTLVAQLISRYMTNQSKISSLREEAKKLSQKLKKLDPSDEEYKKIQDRILDINSELMKENFKTWPVTMGIFMLAFFMLSSMYSYEPINVGSNVSVMLVGNGTVNSSCLNLSQEVKGELKIDEVVRENPCVVSLNGKEFQLSFSNKPQKFEFQGLKMEVKPEKRTFIKLPFSLPIIGNKIGWLGTYVLFSFISSLVITQVLDKLKVGRW